MVLSNGFFYERIQLDTINERFNKVPTAKEGDANGRGMIVVLTENGLVKNTTGVSLLFKWEHTRIAGAQGLEDFEPLDLTKGEYIVTYPAEMNHEGYVKAEIRIIDNGKYAGSRNMKIQVEPSVGDDTAMESSNQFSALVTALLQVNSWNTTIDGKIVDWEADMAATKQLYIDNMEEVEATYPQELLSISQQLADIENTKAEQTALNVEKARIDSFTALASGSTTGDAELIDGRVGVDGFTYPNIGGAIRDQLDNLNNGIETGITVLKKTWTAGGISGNAGSAYTILTASIWLLRYKYLIFTPDKNTECEINPLLKFTIRTFDESGIVLVRTNNVTTKYTFNAGTNYAVGVEAIDGSSIDGLNMNDYIVFTQSLNIKKAMDGTALMQELISNGVYIQDYSWTAGAANGNAGAALSYLTAGAYATNYKYLTISSLNELSIIVKRGYKATIRSVANGYVTERINNIYRACALPADTYAITIEAIDASAITNLNGNDLCKIAVKPYAIKPVPYQYGIKTTLNPIHIGDITRRVQGGCVHDGYVYYAQPAVVETDNTKLVKYNLATGQVELSVTNHSYGHAGAMAYNSANDTLIILDFSKGTTTYFTVNATTLEYVSEASTTNHIGYAIAYDANDGNYWINSFSGNNHFFFAKINTNFEIIDTVYPMLTIPYGSQDLAYDGNNFYIGWSKYETIDSVLVFKSSILVFDKNCNFVGSHSMATDEEIEWCDVYNGKLYAMVDGTIELFEVDRKYLWEV